MSVEPGQASLTQQVRLLKCRHADSYKAIRAPRCGCTTCAEKWSYGQVVFPVLECSSCRSRTDEQYDVYDLRGDRTAWIVGTRSDGSPVVLCPYDR